jgi:AcrR family transcriptional regulator
VPTKLAAAPARRSKRVSRSTGPAAELAPTREVILDTAEQLFALRGLNGVAVRDIARQMQLTAPSLYNHFPSKQALYDAVLERGLRPIVDLLVEAWHPGALRAERMRATLERLLVHLTQHPHLARLLQRALLEETGSVHPLITRWIGPVYRQGLAVIRETADQAGWEPSELPHLALGMFGMVFAYFTNTAALQDLAGANGDPLSPRALAVQRRFLEKAVYRLLGPQPLPTHPPSQPARGGARHLRRAH